MMSRRYPETGLANAGPSWHSHNANTLKNSGHSWLEQLPSGQRNPARILAISTLMDQLTIKVGLSMLVGWQMDECNVVQCREYFAQSRTRCTIAAAQVERRRTTSADLEEAARVWCENGGVRGMETKS